MTHPALKDFFDALSRQPPFEHALGRLRGAEPANFSIVGSGVTAQAILATLLHLKTERPVVLLTESNPAADALTETAGAVFDLLEDKATRSAPITLHAHDVTPYDGLSPHAEIVEKRGVALWRMSTGGASVVVAPIAAALLKTAPAEFFSNLAWAIEVGDEFFLEDLEEGLGSVGYQRNEPVEMVGQMSIRGGIVDVFPPEAQYPVRIEMFGDEVESIREFDPETQKSVQRVDRATLLPLSEYPLRANAQLTPGWEFHEETIRERNACLLDLLDQPIVIWSEPELLDAQADKLAERLESARAAAADAHEEGRYYFSLEGFKQVAQNFDQISCMQLGWAGAPSRAREQAVVEDSGNRSLTVAAQEPPPASDGPIELRSQRTSRFQGNIAHAVRELKAQIESGARAVVAAGSLGDLERLADIFNEYGVTYQLILGDTASQASPYVQERAALAGPVAKAIVVETPIRDGVAFPDAHLLIYGTEDLFSTSELVAKPARRKSVASTFLADLEDLKPGDLVVHAEHGVGRYIRMTKVEQDSRQEDLMMIEYAERAKLYVPLSRLDLVQRFHGAGGKQPALDRMGGQTWQKAKARVKKRLVDMADELLKLYAQRRLALGFAFSPDGPWQQELEDAFPYKLTTDQSRSIRDVKRDMESGDAMDRLICGDVGFGKTEVAMRAAFKALGDDKQVAVLAPTTVLSFQHYETFRQRFSAFPVTVEMLNRFRSPKEQKAILEKLAAGQIDVVIGTHRIFSKDVEFSDLGLLIVDEEQRFGVRHKERLKQITANIDVLTMTATPIPRTLHMSLAGLRDISIIQTAPKDRLAIQTVVATYDERMIKMALDQEIGRGGQVYFIHNRVESIWAVAARLQELVPGARIGIGHGQMAEKELETAMLKFMRHEYDVLVATTIVENGLDIPLANTLIVDRADLYGLSDLYQLRGRVGRSNRRAYAYLMIPPEKELTELARKRLAALKEFSELGSGFKIAALDLELRGGGNLLGAEQSGHIGAVGFETYCRLLEEAVRTLKGEKVEDEVRTTLRLQIDIHIPTDYIAEENQRLRAYKRLAEISNEEERTRMESELTDRYGHPPEPVVNLMNYSLTKSLAEKLRVQTIERRAKRLTFKFLEDSKVDPQRLMRFVSTTSGVTFSPSGELQWNGAPTDATEVLAAVRDVLHRVAK